jgi:LCP family protein required for cell wall assembly
VKGVADGSADDQQAGEQVVFGTAAGRLLGDEPTEFASAIGSVVDDEESEETLEPEPETDDEEPQAPRRSRGRAIAIGVGRTVLALLSVAALAGMTLMWSRVDKLQSSANTTDALAAAQKHAGAPASDDGANDILIVGSDTRTDIQGHPLPVRVLKEDLRTDPTDGTLNTDTLILLRLPKNGGQGYAISIPRDTYVMVPGYREEKINGVFGVIKEKTLEDMVHGGEKDRAKIERDSDTAGRTALIETVQTLTGVRVDHYAEVTMYGFYLLTQAIDGVDVCLNRSTSDPDSGANFRRGPQTVRGADAVSFVRQRKNLPRGDLDRIVRQQTFLSSAMNKVLSGGTLTDNGRLNALADAVSKAVVMDPNLKFLDLVNQAQALASGKVEFVTIPVEAVGARNDRGQSIIVVDLPKVKNYIAQLVTNNPPPKPPPPTGEPPGIAGAHLLTLNAAAAYAVPCVD